jgi:YD repeat-containing protein
MRRQAYGLIVAAVILAVIAWSAGLLHQTMAQSSPTPGSVSYSYDSVGGVVQEIYPSNSESYNYDAAGNRTGLATN